MKRKAQSILQPTAKCIRCSVSIGKPRRSHGVWVRFCPKCVRDLGQKARTAESNRIAAEKRLAARMALSPEERSELTRRGNAKLTPEARERKRQKCSEATKSQKNGMRSTLAHLALMRSRQIASRQAKMTAKLAQGLAECPHCKCSLPLDSFAVVQKVSSSRHWCECRACASIRRNYGRYPFIMKRTGKLNLPVDFRGFRATRTKAIYEQYWVPKLDTGEQE
jgi:hypothetical protein